MTIRVFEEDEIWKDIKDFEGRYQVSNMGNIRSLKRKVKHNTSKTGFIEVDGKVLKPYTTKKWYLHVDLGKSDGTKKYGRVHRIVMETFVPNIDNLPQVNHLNGLKDDNRLENLEWCDNSENQLHAYANGLNVRSDKAGKPKKSVNQIDMCTGEVLNVYESISEASRAMGLKKPSNISMVCKGRRHSAGGFKWEYEHKETGGDAK